MASLIPRSTLAGAIGNTVEWFDFAVYGNFARVTPWFQQLGLLRATPAPTP